MKSELPQTGRVAGVDFGTKRIGVAICDSRRTLASPYLNYERRSPDADAKWFQSFVKDEQVVLLAIGLPVHISGDESQKSREAREFGSWLVEKTSTPVVYVDERYTSKQAEEILQTANLTSKRRKARRDMLAAQMILQAFLELGASPNPPGALDD
ncbi:MAG: Holliday junction resolvase RuvX [Pirellulales bacterium]|nr:Holliday junction resolvase RuvX [Pirellulales bacterium]